MATPTADVFKGEHTDLAAPIFEGGFAITPGTALPMPTRAIWVGSSGNVAVTGIDGNAYTLQNVPAGVYIPIRVASVASTTTNTALNLVGLY